MLKRFENLGTALSRNESKMVVGGNDLGVLNAGSVGFLDGEACSASADCGNGQVATVNCRNSEGGCVGVDRGFDGELRGYAYCQESGTTTIKVASC